MIDKPFSRIVSVFHGIQAPEEGTLAGYGAIIDEYDLPVPTPILLTLISDKNRQYIVDQWQVFTSRHAPEKTLYKQLVFSLKYEGVNLLVYKKLFELLDRKEVEDLVQIEPFGQYSRKIWLLYEWLMNSRLDIPDLTKGNYVPLLNDAWQFTIKGTRSPRHRIINNLPGTYEFCPLIYKTKKLQDIIATRLDKTNTRSLNNIHKDILLRASAFMMIKDSKASFAIEGESPKSKRMARWGDAIGQAGKIPLTKEELIRLQQLVIENDRFVPMGFRTKGGFVGEHDRNTGEPMPDHISARWQDLDSLINGLIATNAKLIEEPFDAVLAATITSFGFVFIHPFADGNGRIHRYLIHHVLARKNFSQQGIIFPVSASMLDNIDHYRKALEANSHPILDFIEWRPTGDQNVEVLNDTIDYYRYFDATRLSEFLYDCVQDTIERIIPEEVQYLIKYDEFKRYIDDEFEMPDQMVALLVRFLEQNAGQLSERAIANEFSELKDGEVSDIEKTYRGIFIK